MNFPGWFRRRTPAWGLLLAVLAGCATYTMKAIGVRDPLLRGDLPAAHSFLTKEKPGGDGLPYLFELGLVLRTLGRFDESNAVFQRAEDRIDDLLTKSLSREVLSLATSDETLHYAGEIWEQVLLHHYRAMNYVDLLRFDDAIVECRKASHRLAVYADAQSNPHTYRDDAFMQYETAILYEAAGELNDAWVSLRLAEEAYERYLASYGIAAPSWLARDLMRVAAALGYDRELEKLRSRYPGTELVEVEELLRAGEIVLFWEEGFLPAKIQEEVHLPVYKNDGDEEDREKFARILAHRRGQTKIPHGKKLDYFLRVALPAYLPQAPNHASSRAVLSAAGRFATTEVAEDLDAIARAGLTDRMPTILFRAVLRAIGKYGITRAVEEERGEIAGLFANLLTAATEKADTRSWITLPRTIQMARLVVEPGTHDILLECRGPHGQVTESVQFEGVEVGAGEIRVLSHRTFFGAR
ncbi:MAG: hypothetical protein QF819_05810 [Gemmatimonadota bacterium]|nr:hypothetical protein [Gemmatimonadota bacterium]MDP6802678.1 hypothetical protein [Gemmatimonadota bacterium]